MNVQCSNMVMMFVKQYCDIILASFVVIIVGIMIIPLPTFLMDILLTFNIAVGICVLLVALYISNAIELSVFPSILLISTLFRLALNISTTRLILLQADAGDIIQAFGHFVVQGNMVVGAIIFLILTLINFIVISKGSERVAEVAARFTLDAMPGKQMAIDADLRTGTIDLPEARRRRRELERESQLFGAMDGAMKFVKGDAIAGIIITCINIIGGSLIGTFMRGLSIGESLKLYGLLTIGDGLVSQIPALIISTSGGLMVTRVAPENEGDPLGRDIGNQFFAFPKALAASSVLLFIFGLIPGLPFIPFTMLGSVTAFMAFGLKNNKAKNTSLSSEPTNKTSELGQAGNGYLQLPIPIMVTVGKKLSELITNPKSDYDFISCVIPSIRERIFMDYGVRIPSIRIRDAEYSLPENAYVISLSEMQLENGYIPEGKALICKPASLLESLLVSAENTLEPGNGKCASFVTNDSVDRIRSAGYSSLEGLKILELHLENLLRRHLGEFIGIQEVKWMCEELETNFPDSVREVIPRCISFHRFTDILVRLVQESVSIRDLKKIIEILAEYAPIEDDNINLTELVRIKLKRTILSPYILKNGNLPVHMVSSEIEDAFRISIQKTQTERYLAMDPDIMEQVIAAFGRELGCKPVTDNRIVVTMDSGIRYVLWKFLSFQFSNVHVISIQELPNDIQLIPVSRISAPIESVLF